VIKNRIQESEEQHQTAAGAAQVPRAGPEALQRLKAVRNEVLDCDFRFQANGQSAIENRQLLVPQPHHGINLRRAASGDEAGQPGEDELQEHDEREG